MSKKRCERSLPLEELQVDNTYQAHLNQPRALKIALAWNPDAVGLLTVSKRKNGSHVVVDGQHRHVAMGLIDRPPARVRCVVFEGLTIPEEARLFVLLNTARKPTAVARFRAAVVAGQPEETAINKIIKSHGLTVGSTNGDGRLTAVTAAQKVYNGFSRNGSHHPELLDQTLRTTIAAWGKLAVATHHSIIGGVGMIYAKHNDNVDEKRFVKQLASYPGGANGLLGAARGLKDQYGGAIPTSVAECAINRYNSGLRNNKLAAIRG